MPSSPSRDSAGAPRASELATPPVPPRMPLFPLGVVVFPGTLLPLRIFEPRYQQLFRDIIAVDDQGGPIPGKHTDGRFCIHLIRFGSEVGGFASPHRIGTVVRLRELAPARDGISLALVQGEQLVELEQIFDDQAPYLVGAVRPRGIPPLGDRPAAVEELAVQVRQLSLRYREKAEQALAHSGFSANLPKEEALAAQDPLVLSRRVGEMLLAPMSAKQRLLEAPTIAHRLLQEREILSGQLARWSGDGGGGAPLPWESDEPAVPPAQPIDVGDKRSRQLSADEIFEPENMIDETDPDYDFSGFNPFSDEEGD